ncbi:MAG: phosphoribosylamine--glycine ligase [Treponema sp.]|nr:phosphoribosylamine--glycine ligase [Spirochaetia bacterium]MDD7768975.1 phosphoribosylamine--glycine ligase [Treponema sp.]MDY3131179.1 phosphoribosylamine--glycine ligase [Treponema sp.]
MNIIVVGNGGREHTICWKLAQSSLVDKVIAVPGNGGTAYENKCVNINPKECDYIKDGENPYVAIAKHENCRMAVIGPEDPLAAGLADEFWKNEIPCVGPKKAGAQLEASKDLSKKFMKEYGVACAASETFVKKEPALEYVKKHGAPIVIKADGLAAGKGVVVAATVEEALAAVEDLMDNGKVGDAGKKLVIEDYLEGVEISVLAAVSVTPEYAVQGKATIVPFLPARDHKRLLDGAKGPNTGGMGSICPLDDVTDETMAQFDKDILQPTLTGLIKERFDYRGFIFFGVMLTKQGPKLLEYNVRLGDPETQSVLPLMNFDFTAMCTAILNGTLKDFNMEWKPGYQVAPVVVSGGYPAQYKKGCEITFNEPLLKASTAKVFVAGAVSGRRGNGDMLTSGGRVLACSAYGSTFKEAWEKAYQGISAVKFEDAFYRKDIGLPGAAESGKL